MPVVAQEAKQYNRIRVAPLTGALGAEVSGVQLRDLDDETKAELHDALAGTQGALLPRAGADP